MLDRYLYMMDCRVSWERRRARPVAPSLKSDVTNTSKPIDESECSRPLFGGDSAVAVIRSIEARSLSERTCRL